MDLMIFDIQRSAVHDGPGIRTTVFLKGCPLRCEWCHNPESLSSMPQLKYIEKNCIACGVCVDTCPHGCHEVTDGIHRVIFSSCDSCGACVSVCSRNALQVLGRKESIENILKVVEKDRIYYEKSGGGLTLSGGEPMLQFEGILELLSLAKKHGLHTCLDTSGQASQDQYEKIIPYVDLFLFDYKITDPDKHKKYIGTDGALIKRNLDFLCISGTEIALRCPIIPGINDDEEHLRAIAQLSRKHDSITEVDIMFYHDIAKGKLTQLGLSKISELPASMSGEDKNEIFFRLEQYDCAKLNKNA